MGKIKNNIKGITLVALVITIIILLILATISIQALTHTGLFAGANRAKLEAKRGQIKEWLSLNLLEVQSKNYDKTAEEILEIARQNTEKSEELKKLGKTVNVDGEISTEEDGEKVPPYYYVIVDKDVYKVEMSGVQFIGEQGKILPVIKLENLTSTTNSIKIKVKTSRNQGGKLEYYIKAEEDKNYTLKQTKEDDSEYIFEELEQNKKYNIKVIAKAENGQQAELTVEKTTGNITELGQEDVEFIYSVDGTIIDKKTWTNKDVTVTAKINSNVDIGNFKMQTSKDGENWKDSTSQVFSENGDMYVILTDGINYGKAATASVTNIDKTAPTVPTVTYNSGTNECKWENNINITLASTDGQSGIAYYQLDWDGDGISNINIDANFIPRNRT